MSDSPEGLSDREVGAILVRLDMIQETLKGLNKMVANHEMTINRMRGALWLMGAGTPFLMLVVGWLFKRLG